MDQSEQGTCQSCTQECDPAIAGGQSHDRSGEGSDGHHTLDTDVDHSAPLREAGTKCRQKKRRGCDQGRIDQKTQVFY